MIHPLNRLLVLFVAPNKVIKKRHDKLLDYDNIRTKTVSHLVKETIPLCVLRYFCYANLDNSVAQVPIFWLHQLGYICYAI